MLGKFHLSTSLVLVFLTVVFVSCGKKPKPFTDELLNEVKQNIDFKDTDQEQGEIAGDVFIKVNKDLKFSDFGIENFRVYLTNSKDDTNEENKIGELTGKELDKRLKNSGDDQDDPAVLVNIPENKVYSEGNLLVIELAGPKKKSNSVNYKIEKNIKDVYEEKPQEEALQEEALQEEALQEEALQEEALQEEKPEEFVVVPDVPQPTNYFYENVKLGNVHFDYDEYFLKSADQKILEEQLESFDDLSSIEASVSGYCDERGTEEYNLRLGEKRATAVRDYLIILGVPEENINYISYGEEYPINTNSNSTAWAENRRAEIEIRVER